MGNREDGSNNSEIKGKGNKKASNIAESTRDHYMPNIMKHFIQINKR